MQRRPGSILATSLSMTAVFLTLVVGAAAYVNGAKTRSTNDRWRGAADQAARSGLDFVMGWAQANIDKESKLPAVWSNMTDGQVIDPVLDYLASSNSGAQVIEGLRDVYLDDPTKGPGVVMGTTPNRVGELIIGREGQYFTTFKVRVQQFRISEDQPRQYRIGVLGRVRLRSANPGLSASSLSNHNSANISNNAASESNDIVAERYVESYIGQVPLSKFAALIDIDGVRNWVPGEVMDGPVHINRGYVDSMTDSVGGTAYRRLDKPILTGDIVAGTLHMRDVRSIMNLRTQSGGLFSSNGGANYPIFNEEVSMTAMTTHTYSYPNVDDGALTTAVQVDGHPVTTKLGGDHAEYDAIANSVFVAPENKGNPDFSNGATNAGPTLLKQPIELPRSVRNRLGAAMGVPTTASLYDYATDGTSNRWFNNLEDGVYIPTNRLWANATALDGAAYGGTATAADRASGGIYIRGNVEVMRMTVSGNYSIYAMQLGYGDPTGLHRCYFIAANRLTKEMYMLAGTTGAAPGGCNAPGVGTSQTLSFSPALMSALTTALDGTHSSVDISVPALGITFTKKTDCRAFALTGAGSDASNICAYFPPNAGSFPFNGTIVVDIAKTDPAREMNPFTYKREVPTTGNIFALGDPGIPGNAQPYLSSNKRQFGAADTAERVSTLQLGTGASPASSAPASRLTILAAGNVFIQNHIYLDSLSYIGADYPQFNGSTAKADLSAAKCKDLFGIVADKQIVFGLAAPSDQTAAPHKPGVIVHGSLAALGDPGFNFKNGQVFDLYKTPNYSYRGSVTTEGLMQYYSNIPEDYHVCYGVPTIASGPAYNVNAGATDYDSGTAETWSKKVNDPLNPAANKQGYPGSPIYDLCGMGPGYTDHFLLNPNGSSTRGQAVVLGSVTQKKRGIFGKGNYSYDKRFIYDRRLLSLAPPIFPTSANVIVKTVAPSTPDLSTAKFAFMKTTP